MSLPPTHTELYGKDISFGWIRFIISETGQVLWEWWLELWHIEDCLEEGNLLRELVNATKNIELPKN